MKGLHGFGKVALMVAVALIVGSGWSDPAWAKTAKEINSDVNACLDRFYRQVPGAKEMAAKAKGVLVLPGVIKAGLIVGGEYGQGALRIDKKSVGYYNIVSGSVGLQIGAEDKDIVILFMNDEALQKFKNTKGWEAGVDANVAVVTMGAGNRVDFTKLDDPVMAFGVEHDGIGADGSRQSHRGGQGCLG